MDEPVMCWSWLLGSAEASHWTDAVVMSDKQTMGSGTITSPFVLFIWLRYLYQDLASVKNDSNLSQANKHQAASSYFCSVA